MPFPSPGCVQQAGATMDVFGVEIEVGMAPGALLEATTPDGQVVRFTVPQDAVIGQIVEVDYQPLANLPGHVPQVDAAIIGVQLEGENRRASGRYTQFVGVLPGQENDRPPGLNYLSFTPGVPINPWEHLLRTQSITITKELDMLEAIMGWGMPHKYLMQDDKECHAFIGAERPYREEQVAEDRSFIVDVALLTGPAKEPMNFLTMEREASCSFLCFDRPRMKVIDASNNNAVVGVLSDSFSCCCLTSVDVHDPNTKRQLMKVRKVDWRPTLCFYGCPCGCLESHYEIQDTTTGQHMASFGRAFPWTPTLGCFAEDEVDTYVIEFNQAASSDRIKKALLLAAPLYMDYRFFSQPTAIGMVTNFLTDTCVGRCITFFFASLCSQMCIFGCCCCCLAAAG